MAVHQYRYLNRRPFAIERTTTFVVVFVNVNNLLLLLLFLLLFFPWRTVSSVSDKEALLKFKSSLEDPNGALRSWEEEAGSSPCGGAERPPWWGTICLEGIVTGIRLESMNLSGKIDVDALSQVTGLRSISLSFNEFSGSIPEFHRVGALKAIYLSGNKLEGEIPADYFRGMYSMKKLWLGENKFSGKIPPSLAELKNLMQLHLENNEFTGTIPALREPPLVYLNVSGNKLEGEIPAKLAAKFGESSFKGNPGLCGKPVGKECGGGGGGGGGSNPTPPSPSSPTSEGETSSSNGVVGAAAGVAVVVSVLVVVVCCSTRKKKKKKDGDVTMTGKKGAGSRRDGKVKVVEVKVEPEPMIKHPSPAASAGQASSKKSGGGGSARSSGGGKGGGGGGPGGMGDLIMVNEEKGVFGLADLMKASAEVLGNGALGSAYKAVMANGVAVAVKRIREMNRVGKDAFDTEMRRLAGLKHENVLTPLAYHYRKEEKLVIYEYVKKGSLLYILHGDRGRPHVEMDWPSRWKIIHGIARGMDYLHSKLSSNDLPHGNLKSSNIFITANNEAVISEYGFAPLISAGSVSRGMFAYKSPEAIITTNNLQQTNKVQVVLSHKSDVFSFGVVLLEILTGKFPSQYQLASNIKGGVGGGGVGGTDVVQWVASAIAENREMELLDEEIVKDVEHKEQMLRLLHIGAACTDPEPDNRPDMHDAASSVQETQQVVLQPQQRGR